MKRQGRENKEREQLIPVNVDLTVNQARISILVERANPREDASK